MAKLVALYDTLTGTTTPIVGSANNHVLTWDSSLQQWVSAAGGGGGGGSGTVTSITAGTGLTTGGSPITTSGTISLAALSPDPSGSYGSASSVAAITVDAYGRVTAASSTSIAIAASAITSGTLDIARGGTGLSSAGGTSNRVVLTTDGSAFSVAQVPNAALANSSLTVTAGTGLSGGGSVALGASTTLSLPNVGTANTYGSASQVPVLTTDAQGRVSGVTNTAIAIAASAVSAIPYDFGSSYPGTPRVSSDIFRWIAVRGLSILASGSRANCKTAPSGGSVSFTIYKNGASIGTIDFTSGNATGSVTITSGPVSVVAGDIIVVTAPANLYSIVDPCFTFAATVA